MYVRRRSGTADNVVVSSISNNEGVAAATATQTVMYVAGYHVCDADAFFSLRRQWRQQQQ